MNFINTTPFQLGIIACILFYVSGLVSSGLLIKAGYIVKEFTFFNSPFFYLHKIKIRYTDYKLGWLPLGISVRPGRKYISHDRNEPEPLEDLPSGKLFFTAMVPVFVSLAAFSVTAFFFSGPDEFINIPRLAVDIFRNSLTGEGSLHTLLTQSRGTKSMLVFSVLLLSFLLLLINFLSGLHLFLSKVLKASETLIRLLLSAITIFLFFILLWKLPQLALKEYTLSYFCIQLVKVFAGLLVSGIILYLITILLSNLLSKK